MEYHIHESHHFSEFQQIRRLPDLTDTQEWCCEGGCSNVTPRLYRKVYSESWDAEGVKTSEHAESYYTCLNGHILTVWDKDDNDYINLPEEHYWEPENPLDLKLEDVHRIGLQLHQLEEKHRKSVDESNDPLTKMFKFAKASITIRNNSTGYEYDLDMNKIKEIEALLLKDTIMYPDKICLDQSEAEENEHLNALADSRQGQNKIRVNIEDL